jgi:hypothetical protein
MTAGTPNAAAGRQGAIGRFMACHCTCSLPAEKALSRGSLTPATRRRDRSRKHESRKARRRLFRVTTSLYKRTPSPFRLFALSRFLRTRENDHPHSERRGWTAGVDRPFVAMPLYVLASGRSPPPPRREPGADCRQPVASRETSSRGSPTPATCRAVARLYAEGVSQHSPGSPVAGAPRVGHPRETKP